MNQQDDGRSRKASAGGEPFLKRWARRKSQAREGLEVEPLRQDEAGTAVPAPDARRAAPETGAGGDVGQAPVELPPLESLGEDSDYSAFMAAGVSEAMRRQALRKLFRSAKFNVIDPLDDYCGNYRNYAALGDVVTSDMKHHAERLLRAQLDKAAEEDEGQKRADAEDAVAGKEAQSAVREHAAQALESDPDADGEKKAGEGSDA